MDLALRDRILASFPNTTYLATLQEYDSGRSGSPVLLAKFTPENIFYPQYGLNGYFIVKIGSEQWCTDEWKFYNEHSTLVLAELLARPHMHSEVVDGSIAIAYDLAFNSVFKTKPLADILDEKNQSERKVQQQVRGLSQALLKWYLEWSRTNDTSKAGIASGPHALLYRMLTPKRADDMLEKMRKYLPEWKPDVPQISVDGLNYRLPNPLAYMQENTWSNIHYNPYCPIGRIHGDLHTGNIICSSQAKDLPKVIDFGQSVPDGVPFFDFAYLEFDIIQHVLPVEREDTRRQWLILLGNIMNSILPRSHDLSADVARAWKLILPIRQQVQEMQKADRENFEIVWWLATIGAGLNFARKGREARRKLERIAGLLYAAYGLARIQHIFRIEQLATEDELFVPWIRGNFSHPISSELPPSPVPPATPHKNLHELDKSPRIPTGGLTQSAPVETPMGKSEVVSTKTLQSVHVEKEQAASPKLVTKQQEEQVVYNQPPSNPVNKIIVLPTRQSEILAIKTHYNDLMALHSSIVSIRKLFDGTKKIQDDQCERIMSFFQRIKELVDELLLEIERLPQDIKPRRFPFRKALRSISVSVGELQSFIADSEPASLQSEISRTLVSLSEHFDDVKRAFDELDIGDISEHVDADNHTNIVR
jgi:hypothetical protein